MKKIYEGLIGGGIAFLVIAFFMDTTVSTGFGEVHNIGLISRQQNLMFFGGILLIAGVIIFAVNKSKQTPEEKAKEDAQENEEQKKVDQAFTDFGNSIKHSPPISKLSAWFSPRSDWAFTRFFVGMVAGTTASIFLGIITDSFLAILMPLPFIWLVFRPVPAAKALKGPLLTNTILHCIMAFTLGLKNDLLTFFFFFVVSVISGFGYWLCRKSLKAKYRHKLES